MTAKRTYPVGPPEPDPPLGTLQRSVLDFIRNAGANGATIDEIEVALSRGNNTIRPRVWELCLANLARDSGRYRVTRFGRRSVVWVAADAPQADEPPSQGGLFG